MADATQAPAADGLREPRPGPLWRWVKVASWVELVIFAALCFFWLAPGYRDQELWFGLGHGIGYVALVALIVVTCFRHQAPYIVLAASLTPVGPLGTVIAIEWVERKKPAYRRGARPTPTASA